MTGGGGRRAYFDPRGHDAPATRGARGHAPVADRRVGQPVRCPRQVPPGGLDDAQTNTSPSWSAPPGSAILTSGGTRGRRPGRPRNRSHGQAARRRAPPAIVCSGRRPHGVRHAGPCPPATGAELREVPAGPDGCLATWTPWPTPAGGGPGVGRGGSTTSSGRSSLWRPSPPWWRSGRRTRCCTPTPCRPCRGSTPARCGRAGRPGVGRCRRNFGGPKGVGALVVRGGRRVGPALEGGGRAGPAAGAPNVAGVVGAAAALAATVAGRGGGRGPGASGGTAWATAWWPRWPRWWRTASATGGWRASCTWWFRGSSPRRPSCCSTVRGGGVGGSGLLERGGGAEPRAPRHGARPGEGLLRPAAPRWVSPPPTRMSTMPWPRSPVSSTPCETRPVRVLVAMYGGVDSSVTRSGRGRQPRHDVVGATVQALGRRLRLRLLLGGRRGRRPTGGRPARASSTASLTSTAELRGHRVVDPYVTGHAEGRTPNPCIECDRHLKFGTGSWTGPTDLGFDAVATSRPAFVPVSGVADGVTRRLLPGAEQRPRTSPTCWPCSARTQLSRTLFGGACGGPGAWPPHAGLGLRTTAQAGQRGRVLHTLGRRTGRLPRGPGTAHAGRLVDRERWGRAGSREGGEAGHGGQRRGMGHGADRRGRFVTAVDVPGRRVTMAVAGGMMTTSAALTTVAWVDAAPVGGPEGFEPHPGPVQCPRDAGPVSSSGSVTTG